MMDHPVEYVRKCRIQDGRVQKLLNAGAEEFVFSILQAGFEIQSSCLAVHILSGLVGECLSNSIKGQILRISRGRAVDIMAEVHENNVPNGDASGVDLNGSSWCTNWRWFVQPEVVTHGNCAYRYNLNQQERISTDPMSFLFNCLNVSVPWPRWVSDDKSITGAYSATDDLRSDVWNFALRGNKTGSGKGSKMGNYLLCNQYFRGYSHWYICSLHHQSSQ